MRELPTAATIVLLTVALTSVASASTPTVAAGPSSGTIGPTEPWVAWEGQHYSAAATRFPDLCPPVADPANTRCDHFFLTVAGAGEVVVEISWPSADNDFDLSVFDGTGAPVASSVQGGTTSERATFQNAGTSTHEVRVNPFLVTDSGYEGTATFTESEAPVNPRHPTGGTDQPGLRPDR